MEILAQAAAVAVAAAAAAQTLEFLEEFGPRSSLNFLIQNFLIKQVSGCVARVGAWVAAGRWSGGWVSGWAGGQVTRCGGSSSPPPFQVPGVALLR